MKNLSKEIADENVADALSIVHKAAAAFAQARFTYNAKIYDDAYSEYLRATSALNDAVASRNDVYRML